MEEIFDFTGDMTPEYKKNKNIVAVKTLRVMLDKQLTNLKSIPSSRANSLAITKL